MRALRVAAFGAVLVPSLLLAQSDARQASRDAPPRSQLEPAYWGLVYDVPATRTVRLRHNVPYATAGSRTLGLDIYQPADLKAGEKRPVVLFVNGIGDHGTDRVKEWGIYSSWPRMVAAYGMIGVSMDADEQDPGRSLRQAFEFLSNRASSYGIDGDRIGLYAASANVTPAAAYMLSDSAVAGLRAAVLYYGRVPSQRLRPELPVLFVVAQSDAPGMRPQLDSLWTRVVDSTAAWTLLFARGQPHAFDAFADNDEARHIVQQTLEFWRSNLTRPPARTAPTPLARQILAAQFAHDDRRATELLSQWTASHASDTTAFAMLGDMLNRQQRYASAESVFVRSLAVDSTHVRSMVGVAQARLGQRRWSDAATMLERVTNRGFETSLVRGQLGFAQLNLGRNEDAARNYERAFAIGIPPGRGTTGVASYNLAIAYARLGRADTAFALLDRAVANGITQRTQYEGDEDLTPLRTDPRFQAFLAKLRDR